MTKFRITQLINEEMDPRNLLPMDDAGERTCPVCNTRGVTWNECNNTCVCPKCNKAFTFLDLLQVIGGQGPKEAFETGTRMLIGYIAEDAAGSDPGKINQDNTFDDY